MAMNARRLLPALALLGLLAGCGDTTAEDPGGSDDSGRSGPAVGDYLADDLPAPFAPGDLLRFSVTADGIGFSATCNSFSGQATWDDGTLHTSALGGTEMGCEPDGMAQDEWLTGMLGGAPAYAVDGAGFTLTGDGVTVTFRPRDEVEPDQPLEGTAWTLDGYGDGETMSSVPAGVSSSLRLEGAQLTIELPCNGTPQPTVEVRDGELVVERFPTTKMSCGADSDAVETAVAGTLRGTVSYAIEAGTLTLTGADGGVLTYVVSGDAPADDGPAGDGPSSGPAGDYVSQGVPGWPDGADPVRLTFGDGEISFSAGCNQFSGPATWADGAFDGGPFGGTDMGCGANRLDRDAWLADFLDRADRLSVDGTDVMISDGETEIWFVPTDEVGGVDPASVPLEGTTWLLNGMGEYGSDFGSMLVIPDDLNATLRIADGTISYYDGCNYGSADGEVRGEALIVGEVRHTLKGCSTTRPYERGFTRVLERGPVSISQSEDGLRLRSANGRFELSFVAQQPTQ